MKTPAHIAIIMDGNRRWARKHRLSILAGHKKVAFNVIETLIKKCIDLKISHLTLWAWSTENWKRDKKEVEGVMKIFKKGLKKNLERFDRMGVRLKVLGDLSKFDREIKKGVIKWIEKSKKNKTIILSIAINYGGRDEILRAIEKHLRGGRKNSLEVKLTERQFSQYLDTAGMPDPDLIIRTGGEKRLSGFMAWQSVYSELYFTETLMPDFGPRELEKAIQDYRQRQRRFGK